MSRAPQAWNLKDHTLSEISQTRKIAEEEHSRPHKKKLIYNTKGASKNSNTDKELIK